MSPIALLGEGAPAPLRGIAPRTFWRRAAIALIPKAPIKLARSAINTIQRLPAPFHFIPTAFLPAPCCLPF